MKTTVRVERHLYRLTRELSGGEFSKYFVGRFRCHNGSTFERKLSADLRVARELLREYELMNDRRAPTPLLLENERVAIEAKRLEEERANRLTVGKFAPIYLKESGGDRRRSVVDHLVRILGGRALAEISTADNAGYLERRRGETLWRRGKPTKIPVSD